MVRRERVGVMSRLCVFMILCLFCTPVFGVKLESVQYGRGNFDCRVQSNRDIYLDALINDIATLSSKIEGVPQESYAYIDHEFNSITNTKEQEGRWRLLVSHQYYPAYTVHKQKKNILFAIKKRRSLSGSKDRALLAHDMLMFYMQFHDVFSGYMRYDRSRKVRLLKPSEHEGLHFDLSLLRLQFSQHVRCLIKALK